MNVVKTLDDLFVKEARRIYAGERVVMDVLPAWIESASAFELETLFAEELKRALVRSQRLEEIGAEYEFSVEGDANKAIAGLVVNAERAIRISGNPEARDVALIGVAQRVAHCQWAAYRAVVGFSKQLGYLYGMDLLQMSMTDIHETWKHLNRLGRGGFLFSGLNEEAQL